MMSHVRFRRLQALLVTASLPLLLLPAAAAAHSDLVSSDPAEAAIVASPYAGPIVLTFSEHLATGSKADLVAASGSTVASAVVDPNAKTMTITPTTPLDPGPWQVRWVSIADDGDLLRGVLQFTVGPAASPSPAASATTAPTATAGTTAPASAVPSAAPSPAPSPDTTDASGTGSEVVVPILVALIILGAGAAYLLTRRNRPPDAT